MSTAFYNSALVLHIIGIALMAGTSFIDFITFHAFSKAYSCNNIERSLMLEDYLNKLQRFLGIGMLIILVSGVIMMVKLHEVWGAQLWFRIKMGILLLIIINGLALRHILGKRLKALIANQNSAILLDAKWTSLKKNITLVQVIQLLLFIIIFILSVFKFN